MENLCPVCKEPAVITCKCPIGDSECKNGHEWHRCLVHKKIVQGPSDHSKDTMACHCQDTPKNG